MKTIFQFEHGKYYYLPEWDNTNMCVTLGDDFKYKLGIYKDGIFSVLESDYLIDDFTKKYIEI